MDLTNSSVRRTSAISWRLLEQLATISRASTTKQHCPPGNGWAFLRFVGLILSVPYVAPAETPMVGDMDLDTGGVLCL
jgi:hypothetical protein